MFFNFFLALKLLHKLLQLAELTVMDIIIMNIILILKELELELNWNWIGIAELIVMEKVKKR